MEATMGLNAMLSMIFSLLFIGLSWWSLQIFKFDLFIRQPNGPQSKLLQVILSVVLGHGVATFIADYLVWSSLLKYIF
jgi:uncharacterized integral membrane protein (TIGR02327 family)